MRVLLSINLLFCLLYFAVITITAMSLSDFGMLKSFRRNTLQCKSRAEPNMKQLSGFHYQEI